MVAMRHDGLLKDRHARAGGSDSFASSAAMASVLWRVLSYVMTIDSSPGCK